MKSIVTKNWDILGRSCSTREIYQKKLITAFRKPKSLSDVLVKARLPISKSPPTQSLPSNPCKTKDCRYFPKLNTSGRITCTATKRSYMAKFSVTCKSSNLIYCITCTKCKIQYVGQTKNRLMDRFQGHFYNIGHNRPMSELHPCPSSWTEVQTTKGSNRIQLDPEDALQCTHRFEFDGPLLVCHSHILDQSQNNSLVKKKFQFSF